MKPNINYNDYQDIDFKDMIQTSSTGKKIKTLSSSKLACIYCVNVCTRDRSKAYSCKDTTCPLWPIKKMTMKKTQTLTEEQIENKRKQLIINRKQN